VNDLILFEDIIQNEEISQVHSKGKITYVILSDGRVFMWPFISKSGEILSQPLHMDFLSSIKIRTMCCGYEFALFLSQKGEIFSFGKDNREG